MSAHFFFYLSVVFILTFVLTGLLRRYAIRRNVLDVPVERSAHTLPTPRGGGVAFVIAVLIALPFFEAAGYLTQNGSLALLGSGVFIATLGFLDDHGHIPSVWRLTGHITAAILALFWVGGLPEMSFGPFILTPGLWLDLGALLYLVWLLNLYNFMDGIDGIAGIEALTTCVGMSGIYYITDNLGLMFLPLVLASGVFGFLCWNFPKARIFMGDAGSGFLGFILGVLSIQAAHVDVNFFWSWVILLGVFIVDATFTLFRRLLRREKVYQAHSMHGYQHASRRFKSHPPVTFGVLLINLVYLLPIAWCVGFGIIAPAFGVCLAYIPLIGLAFFFKAGRVS